MIWIITLIYLAAVCGGLYMLSFVWRNKVIPQNIAHIHGAVAATATALLAIYCYMHPDDPKTALLIFLLVAAGGLYMLFQDRAGKKFPKFVPFVHAAGAIIALLFLIGFIWTM